MSSDPKRITVQLLPTSRAGYHFDPHNVPCVGWTTPLPVTVRNEGLGWGPVLKISTFLVVTGILGGQLNNTFIYFHHFSPCFFCVSLCTAALIKELKAEQQSFREALLGVFAAQEALRKSIIKTSTLVCCFQRPEG